MKKNIFTLCSAILLPLVLFAQQTIQGTITDADDHSPLSGVVVSMDSTYLISVTDAAGHFELRNMRDGVHALSATLLGYEALNNQSVAAGATLNLTMRRKAFTTDEVLIRVYRIQANQGGAYTNLNYADIEKQNLGQDLPMQLNQLPSVVVSSDAGNGVGYTGLRIRGSDPTRVNVTINGIPFNDAESQISYFVDVPDLLSSTQDIQVQRGLGSSTNGVGAFGGSVNLRTNDMKPSAYSTISNSYGSFNTMKNSIAFGTGDLKGGFNLEGRLSRIHSDGYIDRARSNIRSFFFTGGFHNKNNMLKAVVFSGHENTYQAWYGVPQDSLKTNPTFNPAGMYTDAQGNMQYYDNQVDNYNQRHYQLHFTHRRFYDWDYNASLHFTHGRGYYEEYQPGATLSAYGIDGPQIGFIPVLNSDLVRRKWLDNDFYGFTTSMNYNGSERLAMTIGGAANQYLGRHFGTVIWSQFAGNSMKDHEYYNDDAVKSEAHAFTKMTYVLAKNLKAFADLQYRIVKYTFTGFDANLAIADQTVKLPFFNPKFGLDYTFNNNQTLYVYYGLGGKEPNRDDYVQSSPGSRPKAEFMQDAELGYRVNRSKWRASLNAYHMQYKDQLVLTGAINDVGAYNRTNIPASYRQGVEAEVRVQLAKKLEWAANATYSINKIKSFTEYVDTYDADYNYTGQVITEYKNTNIAFSPDVIAGSRISFKPWKPIELALASKYVGKQYMDNTSNESRRLDDFFVNDLLLAYNTTWKDMGIGASLQVNNLFSERYESNGYTYAYAVDGSRIDGNNYFPQAGRNFMVGLTLKF